MKFDQSNRLIKISGPFGETEVCAISFSADETISRLPSFSLDFLALNLKLTGKDIIGKNITVEIQRFDDDGKTIGSRFFNGYVSRLIGGELTTEQTMIYRGYHVEIVPWLWFLTQSSNCHIFFPDQKEKTILDIVEEVFKREYHVQPKWDSADASLLKSRKVEHCVQYRETDFNFISRILEQYGVHYFFKHANGEHAMVLSDKASYPTCEESKVDYMRQTLLIKDNCVTSWEHHFEFVSGKFAQTDYNFEDALDNLETKSPKVSAEVAPDVTSYEIYDYPGEYKAKSDGDKESRIRQEEEEVPHNRVDGASTCKTFCAGHKFELGTHPDDKLKSLELGEYLITSIRHRANQPYTSGTGAHIKYSNDFSCIPAKYAFRPARVTPKPIISGVQTGVVTGPKGEEIYTDEFGRVKVFFHWDRETRKTKNSEGENCSCWIRVAQTMAGRKWGSMWIPRVGQEVVVEFLEGDPDQPLVVGSVYNSDQMPHYDPTEHKTRSYFKTNSTKGGDGFNELMFEDLANEEMIFIHAEKDLDTRVKNCSRKHVGGNMHLIVGRDDADDGGEVHIDIENKLKRSVGPHGIEFTNEGDELKQTCGSQHLTVDGDWNSRATNISQDAGQQFHSRSGMDYAIEAGKDMHIKSAIALVVESGMNLTLKVGGSSIVIDSMGVTIKGGIVTIDGGMTNINSGPGSPPSSGPGCSPTSPTEPEIAKPQEAHREAGGQKSSS